MFIRLSQTLSVALLFIAFAVASAVAEPKGTPDGVKDVPLGSLQPRGTRRWVYNSDPSNTTDHVSRPVAKFEELRQVVRNYAKQGNIDTLVQEVWHQCWTEFWRTDKCPYDARPQHQRFVPIMSRGVMPIEIYIDECHKQGMEFMAGFRMNDRHGHNADFFEMLNKKHPDWILKEYWPTSGDPDPRSYKFGCALDYSADGARDWLFSIMEEVAIRFDIDGIEFNFLRLPQCFPSAKAKQSQAIMTGFVRRVSAMLDEVGRKRGRKLILGVRVPQGIEACKNLGFDIPTWIKERLIGYVAPGDFGFTDFNAKYEDFVRLGRAHDCYVYPQAERRLSIDRWRDLRQNQSPEQYRAVVQNFYGAGADGFSTSNYFLLSAKRLTTNSDALNLLKVIRGLRDPKAIAAGDRHYVFVPLWSPGAKYAGGTCPEQIVLDRKKLGRRGAFRFRMCENLPADSELDGKKLVSGAMLMLKPGIVPGDEIAIDINGKTIPADSIQYEWPKKKGRPPLCRFALGSPPAVYGDNYLGMTLVKSAPGAEGDVVLDEVEVVVKAKKK